MVHSWIFTVSVLILYRSQVLKPAVAVSSPDEKWRGSPIAHKVRIVSPFDYIGL